MSLKKCIFRSGSNRDEYLQPPCFQLNSDVVCKDVPTNGEEFIYAVIRERRSTAEVIRLDEDYSQLARNQSYFVPESTSQLVPESLRPTIEWQNIQVADFSDTRMYISRLLTNKNLWRSKLKKVTLKDQSMVSWKIFFATHEPTLSCVLGLHQRLIGNGLHVLTKLIEKTEIGATIEYKTGQWIYAFLACTKHPVLSDTISILRNLARKCAEIRSHIDPESENAIKAVAPLNIFICIVAKYFRQYDLAD